MTETAVRSKNHTICLNNKKERTLAREGQRFFVIRCEGRNEKYIKLIKALSVSIFVSTFALANEKQDNTKKRIL